jgi:hypothetical protein
MIGPRSGDVLKCSEDHLYWAYDSDHVPSLSSGSCSSIIHFVYNGVSLCGLMGDFHYLADSGFDVFQSVLSRCPVCLRRSKRGFASVFRSHVVQSLRQESMTSSVKFLDRKHWFLSLYSYHVASDHQVSGFSDFAPIVHFAFDGVALCNPRKVLYAFTSLRASKKRYPMCKRCLTILFPFLSESDRLSLGGQGVVSHE